MNIKDVPAFLRQFKNYFPDSKLNDSNGSSSATIDQFLAGRENEQLKIEDFMRLLNAIERPGATSADENLEKKLQQKEGQIAELKDRVQLLNETNESMRADLNESNKIEISLKRTIEQLEAQLRSNDKQAFSDGPQVNMSALQELKYTLDNQPIQEVRGKVSGFVDKLLDKTITLSEESLRLYSQQSGLSSGGDDTNADLSNVIADVQKSFQLQSELLEYYEQITPVNRRTSVMNAPETLASSSEKIDALLHDTQQPTSSSQLIRRRASQIQVEAKEREQIYDSPKIVKSTGFFALYSLLLWFLGIVTTLSVIEYVSTVDWVVSDAQAMTSLVY